MKKGAMFGLDARIALAIFGALSVISGAALYSAIENARLTREWAQYKEYAKAYQAYYIDTATYLFAGFGRDTCDMVENRGNLTGWNGPYISADYITSDPLDLPVKTFTGCFGSSLSFKSDIINIANMSSSGLISSISNGPTLLYKHSSGLMATASSLSVCKSNPECGIYNRYDISEYRIDEDYSYIVNMHNLVVKLDEKLDGGSGSESGDLRWSFAYGTLVIDYKLISVQ